ncbi:uncharacterized protein LOC110674165 [Aedes aegypti]|uniref:Uncharacterized protein n=1 Tax=Aedes aegypti TaxID=7159 RepID=A0A6I8U1Q3_AEDAE|nr:uncharacterized protein LOC110674165 [Aedes aegypti]
MRTMNGRVVDDAMRPIFKYCLQRWTVKNIRIVVDFEQWVQFVRDYNELLNEIGMVNIVIKSISGGYLEAEDAHIILSMAKVRHLYYEHYLSQGTGVRQASYKVTLNTPSLEVLKIKRSLGRNNINFEITRCAKLRSLSIDSNSQTCLTSSHEPIELKSISKDRQPDLSRLNLSYASMTTGILGATFGYLHHICLKHVRIIPHEHPIECQNLTKLVLHNLSMDKPLKLRTPRLQALICNICALNWLQLEDALQADRISINAHAFRSIRMVHPASLSFFRRMNLTLSRSCRYDREWFNVHGSYLEEVRELRVSDEFPQDHHEHLQDVLGRFTAVSSLSLRRMRIPSDFSYLTPNVQKIHIKDCETETNSIRFPPSVCCVEVCNMWKWNTTAEEGIVTDCEMILLPKGRFGPLRSRIAHGRKGKVMAPRTIWSTQRVTV